MSELKRIDTLEGKAGHPALCVLPEIEKEDELFEIIWTLKEEGNLTSRADHSELYDKRM